jgi:nucleotide-binding universal stress UspA family protein
MFKAILAATDGSDHAAKAVGVASDLAARHGADLVIAHVMSDDEPLEPLRRFAESENIPTTGAHQRVRTIEATPQGPVPLAGGEDTAVDVAAARREIGERVLHEAAAVARRRGAETLDCVLLEGKAAGRIVDSARERGVDAIVLGSRGLGTLKRTFFGSVSQSVCEKADCTCITVN